MINTISADASKGAIIVTQADETSPFEELITGVIMPTYAGIGPPIPDNLVGDSEQSPYYRQFCYWLDITSPLTPIGWICVTAGDNVDSAWAKLSGGGGGYIGEYDSAKAYTAGEQFSVALPTIIAGISVSAGLYGVPPAGTDSLGTWAGSVPASPTGNQVPQDPLPGTGTLYARLLSGSCSIL